MNVAFDVDYSKPNNEITAIIKNALEINHEKYYEGKTVSVPCTFFHPPKNRIDEDVISLSVLHIRKIKYEMWRNSYNKR